MKSLECSVIKSRRGHPLGEAPENLEGSWTELPADWRTRRTRQMSPKPGQSLLWAEGPDMWNELGRQTGAGINSAIKTRANSPSEARALYRAQGWLTGPTDPPPCVGPTEHSPAQLAAQRERKGLSADAAGGEWLPGHDSHRGVLAWVEPTTKPP